MRTRRQSGLPRRPPPSRRSPRRVGASAAEGSLPRMADVTAPTAAAPAATSPNASTSGDDWTVQAADTIETVVGAVRDKTVVPLTTVARGLVYGLIAAVLGVIAVVLLTIASLRVVIVYLPGWFAERSGRSVWAADVIIGGIFTLAGLFLLRKASTRKGPSRG